MLKPGATFAIYEIMRKGAGDLAFPVPWVGSACFDIVKLRDRTDFAFDFFREIAAKAVATGGPPPVGIHLLMGANAKAKLDNVIASLERGLIVPTEIIARAR